MATFGKKKKKKRTPKKKKKKKCWWGGGGEVTTGMAFSPHPAVIFHKTIACKMWPVSQKQIHPLYISFS